MRLLLSVIAAASLAAQAQSLPVFPANNVPETFFGTVVDDPYRALENEKDPAVAAWMKAHAQHAQRTIESLPGYPKTNSAGCSR
jgi:prolyl oligopeptidase